MDDFGDDLSNAVTVQPRTASPLAVRFFIQAMRNAARSTDEGRDIFVDTEMIEVRIPGQSDIIRRPVTDQDRKNYARVYEAFKSSTSQEAVEGFPLSEWPLITRAQAEELRYFGIRTVEQFAGCADTAVQRIGPYMQMRQKARDWLEQAQKGAVLAKLRSENDDLRARLTALESMVEMQSAEIKAAREGGGTLPAASDPRMARLEEQLAALAQKVSAPKRRGRPPKQPNGTES